MSIYHDKQRALQDAFDTRRLADVIESNNLHVTFNPLDEAFIAGKDFFFLATADASGKPSCSFKAGPAGFVRMLDERTLGGDVVIERAVAIEVVRGDHRHHRDVRRPVHLLQIFQHEAGDF